MQPKLNISTDNLHPPSEDDLYRYSRVGEYTQGDDSLIEKPITTKQSVPYDSDDQLDNQLNDQSDDQSDIYPNTNEFSEYPEFQDNHKADKNYRLTSRLFFAISVISAILILTLEAYVYAVINIHKQDIRDSKYQELSIYLALFIFAAIFQIMISIIGLKTKNVLLLLTLCLFYACMLIYTGIQYQEVTQVVERVLEGHWRTATRATNIATIAVLAATMIIQMYLLLFHLKDDVKWFSFKTVGGNIKTKRLYQVFQIHRSLLVFGYFFFLGFTIQFIIIMVQKKSSVEFILTVIVLPLTIGLLTISDFAIKREILVVSIGCFIFYLGGIAYVLFKTIRLYTKYTSAYDLSVDPGNYFPGRNSLVTFGAISLFFLVGIVVSEVILIMNFKKGLKTVNEKDQVDELSID